MTIVFTGFASSEGDRVLFEGTRSDGLQIGGEPIERMLMRMFETLPRGGRIFIKIETHAIPAAIPVESSEPQAAPGPDQAYTTFGR
jgi:hypothetical protein